MVGSIARQSMLAEAAYSADRSFAVKTVVVRIARFVHAEQVAQVVKMPLRPAAFGKLVVFPEVDEFFGGHVIVSSSINHQ